MNVCSRASGKRLLAFVFATSLFLAGGRADPSGTQPGCNNPVKPKPCDCEEKRCTAANPIDIAGSNVMRDVRDLEVFGGVGEHQLHWTRYGHSRTVGGGAWFGDGHIWRHSYQWEMSSPGAGQLEINYPDGGDYTYTYSGGAWRGIASNPDQLSQNGSNYYLRRQDGFTYHFVQVASSGQTFYQMQNFTDSFGAVYNLTYDASNRVTLVSEPAGRWLRVTYQDVPVNQQQFTTLHAQSAVPAAGWTTVNVNNATAFRYLRYFSTEPGSQDSFCNVAEVEFYDTAGNKLSGTPFGSTPAWNNGSSTFDKAFDGNTGTFFDYASRHFGFTGIDLGAGNAKAIGQIRFYPRSGYEIRMAGANGEGRPSGGRFEGSNVAPVTENVIAKVEAGYGSGGSQTVTRAVQYNYATLADPVLASGWLTLSGASYGDGTQAQYVYQSVYAGQHPLLLSADDPRLDGAATRIKYEFWNSSAYIMGAIYAERDFASNQILAKLEGEGGDGFGNTGRKITYANGGVKHAVMGADNNVTGGTDELGHATSYSYGANNGFLGSETDALGHTTSYTRDAQGRVLSTTYADNSTESWTRDALGHVLTHKDERGYTTTWTRNANGRVTRIDYPNGGYETFTYNGFRQVLTHRQTNGGTESFAYDTRGLKTSWTDALNHPTTYAYDANDLLASVTDPLNHATTYAHNERGQVTQVTYADNTLKSYGYDAYGNRLSTTNELGKTWSSAYDAYKRKITATDPLNRTTQYWYDEPGSGSSGCGGCGSGLGGTGSHLTTVILPSGKTTKINYDLAWRKTGQTVGYNTTAAATTGYGYDAANNLISTTDGRGKVTTYAYDSRNRRMSTTDPLNHPKSWTYDAAGNILTEKSADNQVTSYVYDAMNRRTKTTDPLNQIIQMAYDAAGKLVTLTDARNNSYGFTYDLRNSKTRMTYPGGSHEDWTYDAEGNATAYVNRAGNVKTITFDVRDREINAVWNDSVTPEVMTSYDAAGRVLTLNNRNSALTYAYDHAGQILSETQAIADNSTAKTDGPSAKTFTYGYDVDGNRSALTYPDGQAITYTYTPRNQMASVSLTGPPPLVAYTYDLAGNRTGKALENGVSTAYVYDNDNRVLSISHSNNSGTLASFAYTYNVRNDRLSVTRETGLGDVYSYDATDQLIGSQYAVTNPTGTPANPQKTESFTYDAVGNRTSVSENGISIAYSTNTLNQYAQVGSATPVYDVNGNMTSNGAGFAYTYDAQNRMLTAQSTVNGTCVTVYDARNRAVKRIGAGVSSHIYYDGWKIAVVYNHTRSSDVEQKSYVHGVEIDELLARIYKNELLFYQHDALGNTTMLTGQNGQLLEKYSYDVFGNATIRNAAETQLNNSAYGNQFMFSGREWSALEGVYNYRSRAFMPTVGSFLQIDPLRLESKDVNFYRYVFNNPVMYTDPFGLSRMNPFSGGLLCVSKSCKKSCKGKRLPEDGWRKDPDPWKDLPEPGTCKGADGYAGNEGTIHIRDNCTATVQCDEKGETLSVQTECGGIGSDIIYNPPYFPPNPYGPNPPTSGGSPGHHLF